MSDTNLVQAKYDRIMTLMLDGVAGPVNDSQQTLDRLCASFLITPPPPVMGAGPQASKAQQIQEALARAERLARTLEQLELILDSTLLTQGNEGGDQQMSAEIDALLSDFSNNGVNQAGVIPQHQYVGPPGTNQDVFRSPHKTISSLPATMRSPVFNGGGAPYAGPTDTKYDIERLQKFPAFNKPKPKPKPAPEPAPIVSTPRANNNTTAGGGGGGGLPALAPLGPMGPMPSAVSTTPAAKPAAAASSSGGDDDEKPIVIPKWEGGPPSSPDEIEKYKQFMVRRLELEALENARILRLRKKGKA